jgi:hypothetical protein
LTIYANEEGKVHNLPVNRRATCMWWLLSPTVRGSDVLVGDVVIGDGASIRQIELVYNRIDLCNLCRIRAEDTASSQADR